jgi:hypothetical protein
MAVKKRRAKSRTAGRVTVGSVNVPGFSKTLNADKYTATRVALLAVLPRKAPGITQREMFEAAKAHLPAALFPKGAKAEWWIKSVQLDLEAKGIVVRDPKAKPLRWWRAPRRAADGPKGQSLKSARSRVP